MIFKDKVYDTLKWVVMIVLPACGTLYAALSTVWALPYAREVVTTLTSVTAFLGALLGISTMNYYQGGDGNG